MLVRHELHAPTWAARNHPHVTATLALEPLPLRICYRRMSEEVFMKWLFAGVIVAVATAASAAPQSYPSSAGNLTVETFASGLANPWAFAFLPDGRLIVTEKAGRMRLIGKDGKLSAAIAGVPAVFARGQGGLHDVVLDRDYAQNNMIYFCFPEPANGGGRTALAR